MYEDVGSRSGLNAAEMSVLISQRNGQVTGLSRAARRLLGSADSRPCWSLMKSVAGGQGLPCTEGCVRELLANERPVESHRVALRGGSFDLRCEPVGDQIVTTLHARSTEGAPDPERLTPREIEVLKLLADGFDGKEIADRLGIRTGTVRTHVEHMRERLDCRTRAGLVAKGYQLHYLP